jgi:hypothetical protein
MIDDNLHEDDVSSDSEDTWDRILKRERHEGILCDLGLYDDARTPDSGLGYKWNDLGRNELHGSVSNGIEISSWLIP